MTNGFRLAAAAAVLMFPLAALPHAKLLSTSPAAGAELPAAPKVLTLEFNESVKLAVLKLSTGGKNVAVPYDGTAAAAHVVVQLPSLAAGTYEVRWSAMTVDDGHVVKGSFSFAIKP